MIVSRRAVLTARPRFVEDPSVRGLRAFVTRVPWWGLWIYFAVFFGALEYFFLSDRSVGAAVTGGAFFATVMTAWTSWQRAKRRRPHA